MVSFKYWLVETWDETEAESFRTTEETKAAEFDTEGVETGAEETRVAWLVKMEELPWANELDDTGFEEEVSLFELCDTPEYPVLTFDGISFELAEVVMELVETEETVAGWEIAPVSAAAEANFDDATLLILQYGAGTV